MNQTKKFAKEREQLARKHYDAFNASAFKGKLPVGLELTWSNTLNTTAGRAHLKRLGEVYSAKIELSTKVCDVLGVC